MLGRSTAGKGEKRLHVAQISAVQWKPAGSVVNGFIQFTLPGGNERRSQFGAQTNDAARDENSVVFTKKQQPELEKLRGALDEAIAAQHSSTPPSAPTPSPLVDELTKLAGLHESGMLTNERGSSRRRPVSLPSSWATRSLAKYWSGARRFSSRGVGRRRPAGQVPRCP
ncbi:DUF4429 domain-containing protein [Streptomyces sp. H39-S7]|uniref:DUF4429 domain-containing protein n=1 Tax=Streptomyces sp. H39-S7 TaxID=3004357 RepID=UPI0022B066E9|nr:DUF4429 domain-containing protein [Streptomyces sp. H39-S7]MCZ4117926.1 DUF4429 domain-containing protein [Streptomyces sp. H39-S7]